MSHKTFVTSSVACAGFVLAGTEKNIRWGRQKFSVPPKKKSAPTPEFDSAPGVEQAREGQKVKEGETSNNRE